MTTEKENRKKLTEGLSVQLSKSLIQPSSDERQIIKRQACPPNIFQTNCISAQKPEGSL
jgi:hypothetical protein